MHLCAPRVAGHVTNEPCARPWAQEKRGECTIRQRIVSETLRW